MLRLALAGLAVTTTLGTPAAGQARFFVTWDHGAHNFDKTACSTGRVIALQWVYDHLPGDDAVVVKRWNTDTDTELDGWNPFEFDPERPYSLIGLSGDGSTLLGETEAGEVSVWIDGVRYVPQPLTGAVSCEVTHVTAGQEVLGYCTMSDGSTMLASWMGAQPTSLGIDGEIYFVSAEGLVIVGVSDGWVFRWESGLTDYIVEGVPRAINADGSVIAGETETGAGFRWRSGVLEAPLPHMDASRIQQVTDGGEIIRVELVTGDGSVLWRDGQIERFDDVYWMSDNGQILVGDDGLPFVYMNGVYEHFVSPAYAYGGTVEIRRMSADGTVVVGQVDALASPYSDIYSTPFIWTPEAGFELMCDYLDHYGLTPSDCRDFLSGFPPYLVEGVSRNGRAVFGRYTVFGEADGLFYVVVPRPCSVADVTTQGAGPSDPLYGRPDEIVTVADLNYYVNQWIAREPAADLTTQNAPIGDPLFGVPDGGVSAIDLQFYVNSWLEGCP